MIQFNLLPDVKIEYIRTQKTKRIIVLITTISVVLSLGILFLSFSFSAVRKQHLSNLDKDITAIRTELESDKDLGRILSVQNQLNSLPELYAGRPAADRLTGYLNQTTPSEVGLGRVSIDFTSSTIELVGTASSLEAVNAHVDTLKFTTFKASEDEEPAHAFTDVVLSRFGRDRQGASFTITLSFTPDIFDASNKVQLLVPNIITTRTQATPTDIFNGSIMTEGDQLHAE